MSGQADPKERRQVRTWGLSMAKTYGFEIILKETLLSPVDGDQFELLANRLY